MASSRTKLRITPLFQEASWVLIAGLIAIRVLAIGLILWDYSHDRVVDVDAWRAERIATSPATPYRDFAVEYMPLETLTIELVSGHGIRVTAAGLALAAFAGDLAAAGALAWGWGRRQATTYLLLGLPLLAFLYQRFDLVSVALIAWALALERRKREVPSGVTFALAILTKLWPVVLLPILWIHRRTRAIVAGAVVAVIGGAAWYAVGGPKGPVQVLTFRGAIGWSVESTVGNLVWIITQGQTGPDAGTTRIGIAPAWARLLLLVGLLVTLVVIWRRATADGRDPAGGSSLAAVAALLVFSPLFSIQYATWLLPWASIAFEGDEQERRVAAIAVALLAICGVLGVAYLNEMPLTPLVEKWLLFVRNGVAVWLLATWLYETRRSPLFEARA